VRCSVHPSPNGGWHVRVDAAEAPVSRHDTEEEAVAVAAAYELGLRRTRGIGTECVELRDGSELLVRPLQARDKALLVTFFERLSEQSRYRRFIGYKRRLSLQELVFFTEVDHIRHDALIAVDPHSDGGATGAAVARFVAFADHPGEAEVAVAVIDAWQGRGLGTLLLDRLAGRALAQGIHTFRASVLAENTPMLALFRRLGPVSPRGHDGGTLEIAIDLAGADGTVAGAQPGGAV
jgi:GNAT superfamily N-acetyltransferase